jgi:predicted ATPase
MSSSENSHQIAAAAAVEAIGVDCSGDASTTSGLSWSYEQNASVYGRGEESLLDDPQISDRALPKLPSTSARISSESVLQGLSINKLNFHRVQLQGRQKETDQLKSLWNDIWLYFSDKQQLKEKQIQDDQHYDQNDITETPSSVDTSSRKGSDSLNEANNNNKTSCKKILAIVDGLSGVGKSKLVTSVLKSSVQSRHSFFITGKFDLKNIHVPFDGIMMAVDDLCDQILRSYLQEDTLNTGAIKGNGGDAISGAVSALASKPSDTSISPLSPTSIGRKTVSGNTIFSKLIRFNEIKQLILGELSQELPFLISIFPKLLAIVGDDYDGNGGGGSVIDGSVVFGDEKEAFVDPVIDRAADGRQQHGVDNNDTGMTASDNLKANADRLKYCVRRFIQVICSYRPLVVFCDDCQWADDSSLDVLHQLLTDGSNHDALMVVCAFRTDEVFTVRDDTEEEAEMEDETTSDNPMAIFLKKANHLEGALFSTHRLSIGNLSIEDLNAFLLDLLASDSTTMSQKETMDLALVLFEKTTGNIFFVVQVLLALQEKGFISYNLGLMKWIWDAQEIKENVPVADNIVEFVKAKLQKDANARQLLPIAACIGSRFDDLSLARVIRGLRSSFDARAQTKIDNSESLESFLPLDFDVDGNLERCCREGYIQRLTTGASACRFQFVHDRVQEAAMKTAPEHLQVQLKHQVGSILARDLPEEELPSMVFTILGLVNEEMLPQSNETKRLYLKLNMLAGEKAMSYSAFKSAAIYFKNAVELLPDDSFEKQYSMTFRVYLAAAEAEFCLGNFDTMNKYCDAVLSNNLVAAVDKLRISNIVMDSLVAQNKARQSIDLAIASLAQCGCYFPRNPLRTGLAAAVGLMRTKFSRKMQDPASIANLPFSADPAHATVMKTLDKLATATFVAGASDLFPLVILKRYASHMAV